MSTTDRRRTSESESKSSEEDSDQDGPPIKRSRVAMACVRCRARKQKCDGALPSCSTCMRLGVRCRYKPKAPPGQDERQVYITALETRIAELETYVSNTGLATVSNDHWRQPQEVRDSREEQEIDVLHNAMKGLLSSASGNDLGPESKVSLGRILGSIIKGRKLSKYESQRDNNHTPKSISRVELVNMIGPMFVSPTIATRLFDGWMNHLAVRYPAIHTPRLRELHARRDDHLDIYEQSILHLVYANSGLFLERAGETGDFFAEQHYEAALQNMDAMLEFCDTRSISYLFLMAVYCLRSPRDPGAWTLAGLAMRLCVELGLHRRSPTNELTIQRELDKRLFWGCFYLDREISGALSRPAGIAEYDIGVELPIDIDEDVDDLEALKEAAKRDSDQPSSPPTTLTIFIHFMRLKLIQARIDSVIYRSDRYSQVPSSIVQGLLDKLSAWKQAIPAEFYKLDEVTQEPRYGIDIFLLSYYRSVRSLLYPQLSESPLNTQYLRLCAEAGAGVCEGYKRLHRRFQNGYSPVSLQSIFLAGLTMLYCTWLAPDLLPEMSGPISDCNIMLYVMTDRWPAGRKYRDVFERMQGIVTDAIVRGNHLGTATGAVKTLNRDVNSWGKGFDPGLTGGVRNDITQMINGITGQRVAMSGTELSPAEEDIYNLEGCPSHDMGNFQGAGVQFEEHLIGGDLTALEGFNAEWDLTMLDGMDLTFRHGELPQNDTYLSGPSTE